MITEYFKPPVKLEGLAVSMRLYDMVKAQCSEGVQIHFDHPVFLTCTQIHVDVFTHSAPIEVTENRTHVRDLSLATPYQLSDHSRRYSTTFLHKTSATPYHTSHLAQSCQVDAETLGATPREKYPQMSLCCNAA